MINEILEIKQSILINKMFLKPITWWFIASSFCVILFCFLTVNLYSEDKKNKLPDGAEEWLYVMTYDNFRFNVMAYEYNKTLYLPLTEIASLLQIFMEPSERNKVYSGYIIRLDSIYELNTISSFLKSRGKKYNLAESDYIASELEIFVTSDVLSKLFGLDIQIQKQKLEVKVKSNIELPVLLEYKRKKKYSSNEGSKEKMFAPLISGRDWHILNGGVMEYQLTGQKSVSSQGANYMVNTGLEVLGGEMKIRSSGSYNASYNQFSNYNLYEWNYTFNENKYLTQVKAGNISNTFTRMGTIGMSNDIYTPQILGVQITNETFKTPATFTNFVFEDKIEPGWTVELYVNNRLYSQTISDPNGYYKLELPVSYGASSTMLKFYSPYGDYREVTDEFDIPSEFIDPGELKYTITGGKINYSENYILDCRSTIGITNWATTTLTYQNYIGENKQNFMAHIATRLPCRMVLNADISPKEFYAFGLRYNDKKSGAYDFIINKYDQSELTNVGKNYSLQFSGSLPRFVKLPFNLGFRGSRDVGNSTTINRISSNLSFSLFRIGLGCNYSYNYIQNKADTNITTQSFSGSANYSWIDKPKWLSFLSTTSFNTNLQYDFYYKKIRNVSFSISQGIGKICYIQLSGNTDLIAHLSNFNVGVSFNLASVRSSTNSYMTNMGNTYSQNLQGNVAFDASNFGFDFNSNTKYNGNIQTGNAKIRLYMDENLNSKYDPGEIIVPNIGLKLDGGGNEVKITKKGTYLNGLDCSERYNVGIIPESIKNPLVLPAYQEFSIMTNPNSVKSIDIPCYYTGILEGSIKREVEEKTEGQAGVKVHFRNKDNGNEIIVPVYSDGTFYQFGMIPGKYIAYIDTLQVSLLECTSDPKQIEFTMKSMESGDYFGDLNFVLYPKFKSYKKKIDKIDITDIIVENPKNELKSTANAPSNSSQIMNKPVKPIEIDSTTKPIGVNSPTTPIIADTTSAQTKYNIQLLASRQPVKVNDRFAKLLVNDPKLTITELKGNDGWYRYCTGAYSSEKEANESMKIIKKSGWKSCFVTNTGK